MLALWLTPCIANTSQEPRLVMACHQLPSVANVLNNWPSLAQPPASYPTHPATRCHQAIRRQSMKVYLSKVLLITQQWSVVASFSRSEGTNNKYLNLGMKVYFSKILLIYWTVLTSSSVTLCSLQ